jgi:hypothetical protein
MAMSIGTTFAPLTLIYCENPGEWFMEAVIRHSSARATLRLPRTRGALRYLGRALGWRTVMNRPLRQKEIPEAERPLSD